MITQVPIYVQVIFMLTVFLTLGFFYKAANGSRLVLGIASAWIVLQSSVSLSLFYANTDIFPPRFLLMQGPVLVTIVAFFLTKKGRAFIDSLDLTWLTAIHIVRIPVELVLYWLFLTATVPQLMTFAGRNFDVIAGVTAPLVLLLVFYKNILSRRFLLGWNAVCLLLVLFIVYNAILSAPFPIQQFGFDQPNIAVFYFPFSLLPGFVVPIVIFSHLASIRKLIGKNAS